MEQLGLTQEDWDFIKENIGAFCMKSDEQCRTVLEAEGRPLTQEEIDKLVDEMFDDEFDEMTGGIILEVLENFGYVTKKKRNKKQIEEEKESDSDSDTDSDSDSDSGETEDQEQEVEAETK